MHSLFNNKPSKYKKFLDLKYINFSYTATRFGPLDHLEKDYCNYNHKFLSFN